MQKRKRIFSMLCCWNIVMACCLCNCSAQAPSMKLVPVAKGWANNTVNTVIFRKNALVSWKDLQFIAFYNQEGYVVLGKRKLGSTDWQLQQTRYRGNIADAHNCISIMVDGEGYLHMAWDHHANSLHYCKSLAPGSLDMSDQLPMTGKEEHSVTYPEFYRLSNGNILFLYRNGASGKGNLVLNQYQPATRQWTQLHNNLVDGEGKRNAYWQAYVDKGGTMHISWVWRESPDVSTNHDLCYARSTDGGITWEKSTGEKYTLPITAATAEYVCRIPQNSELINQTSICADEEGNPYIATYWKEQGDSVPQYHIVYRRNKQWNVQSLSFRKTAFSLKGVGSKRIPIARPQIISWTAGHRKNMAVFFRDEERKSRLSVAFIKGLGAKKWELKDLTGFSIGSSEPLYDTELWKQRRQLHFFTQFTEQRDSEGKADIGPQMVQVLEWNFK